MRQKTTLLHLASWAVMLLMPLQFLNHGNGVSLLLFIFNSVGTLLLMGVFYANYFWLTPRYFVIADKRYVYWTLNTILVVGLGVATHYWMHWTHTHYSTTRHAYEPTTVDTLVFILRNVFNLSIAAGIATTMQLSMRWHRSEEARLEAEAARTDAELSNLRNQVSPHFLLNTLNNIYALTAFDTERAQNAIDELSKLLRHMLYTNQQQLVDLREEAQFLESYVELMKIRLATNVDVSWDCQLPSEQRQVAPLIFISLVENAFKHGVSPTGSSFVKICLRADSEAIVCDIENSNHPKTSRDNSGHGIGLQQVQRRLDLCYPGRYTWQKGTSADGKTYRSTITLHDR